MLKTEGSTQTSSFKARQEDLKIPSSYIKEKNFSKPTKATREASTLWDLDCKLRTF
jgi:hypothetical protein